MFLLKFWNKKVTLKLQFSFWMLISTINFNYISVLGYVYLQHQQERLIFLVKSSLYMIIVQLLAIKRLIGCLKEQENPEMNRVPRSISKYEAQEQADNLEKDELFLYFFQISGNGVFFIGAVFEIVYRICKTFQEESQFKDYILLGASGVFLLAWIGLFQKNLRIII